MKKETNSYERLEIEIVNLWDDVNCNDIIVASIGSNETLPLDNTF